jgi:hypothetical protein
VLRGLINDVPIWLLLIVVVGAIVGIVLGLVWLIRRLVPSTREGFDAEVSSQLLGVVAALFGLLLAFIVVIAYQNYGDTQSNVSNEADALAAIVRDSAAFPQPDSVRIHTAVGAYVRAVVNDEWPRMHEGKDSARAAAAVAGMYRAIQGVDPKSSRAVAFYDDAVRQLSTDRSPAPRGVDHHRGLHGARRVAKLLVPRNRGRSGRDRPGPVARRPPRPDLPVLR